MRRISMVLAGLFAAPVLWAASLELASPFGEGMVLQQKMPVPVWGWDEPGREVVVEFGGHKARAVAGTDGRWRCELPPLEASAEPLVFRVSDGASSTVFTNVLVGEVWICCGQSNMQMGYGRVPDIAELVERTVAEHRPVRTLNVRNMISIDEADRCPLGAAWSTQPPPSAVAASFACLLQADLGIPVGVVLASWGSSSLEGWMPRNLEDRLPRFKAEMERELDPDHLALCRKVIASARESGKLEYADDEARALAKKLGARNANIYCRTRPNLLYNAMLHPLIPMACRGMVYYQGEANANDYDDMARYAKAQRSWLRELRKEWGNRPFFLLSVMLPGFGKTLASGPSRGDLEAVDAHSWAIIRESQMRILDLPNTAVANTIDLGEAKNIHPRDKMPVGRRLALLARRAVYGESGLLAAGPLFQRLERSGDEITVRFKDADGLHTTDGKPPRAFWLGGNGMPWTRAEAAIRGDSVALKIPEGTHPAEVRYAYAAKPDVNLVNRAGLPAYPFRAPIPR